jgi:ribosomal protein L37E
MSEKQDFPRLTEAEKIRWRAVHSDMNEMSATLREGTATAEDIEAALNRLMSHGIDHHTLTNALHVPDDAGPYAPALERIVRRIPDGWGRWISLDAGWYPIVSSLDERLAAIDPDYILHQVKEKFGTLRYYCTTRPGHWEAFKNLIGDAERTSAITCERCGEPGALHHSPHRIKTLCATCADTLGYLPKLPGPSA